MNCQVWELFQDGELNPYTLPTIAFTAGETQTWVFDLFRQSGLPFDSVENCLVEFAMSNHIYRDYDGEPGLYFSSEEPSANGSTIRAIMDGETSHKAEFKLAAKDTIDFNGKYIYQIFMTDQYDNSEPLGQGFLYITPNLLRGKKSGS